MKSLQSEVNDRNNEINNLHTLIDKIQDDKQKLSKKISKLLDNGLFLFLKFKQNFKNLNEILKFNRKRVSPRVGLVQERQA